MIIAMYIERVPNRGSPPAVLVREGWRESGKVRKATVANLSHLPEPAIEAKLAQRHLCEGHAGAL